METADNLSKSEFETAQVAKANISEGVAEDVNLGKFKDVSSLLNAYNSLEAEFTRRSQRLKEMEGAIKVEDYAQSNNVNLCEAKTKNANSNKENTVIDADLNTFITEGNNSEINDSEIVDNLKDDENQNIEIEVKDFLNKFPDAVKFSKDISDIAAINKDFKTGFLQRAYVELLQNKLSGSEKLLTDENHLKNVILNNSTLKEAVIREYLNNIKAGSKLTLLSDNGKGITMPPKKPKTIEQAGFLAKEFLTKNKKK